MPSLTQTFIPQSTEGLSDEDKVSTMRRNGLGSLFYFITVPLRRSRLTTTFHYPICRKLESDHIKFVFEVPRDHFKSTMASEGLPMWWALPYNDDDLNWFLKKGYSDEFVKWVVRHHDPNTRIILVSETEKNAAKLGSKIRWHFESNAVYRGLYPETLPDSSCTWGTFSLHVKRPKKGTGGAHGEGTFDFIGVGGALQSRHYIKAVEDDLIGRKGVESPSIMDKAIDYHRLLPGCFESLGPDIMNDQLVIGNRWSYHDLNSWIKENEPEYIFETHDAMGGCCPAHPSETAILPTEFSMAKLAKLKVSMGTYRFSCQYRNNPAAPEDSEFKEEWLNHFRLEVNSLNQLVIVHEVKDGRVRKDLPVANVSIGIMIDPAHAANAGAGRCRHAVVVLAKSVDDNYYLLQAWADNKGYDAFYDKVFDIARRWRKHKVGVEVVAAQKFVAHHITSMNRYKDWKINQIIELKGEVENDDGTITKKKQWRIRNKLGPIFEFGRFWIQRHQMDFLGEYTTFPRGRFVDQLDACAYGPDMIESPSEPMWDYSLLAEHRKRASLVNTPYTARVQ